MFFPKLQRSLEENRPDLEQRHDSANQRQRPCPPRLRQRPTYRLPMGFIWNFQLLYGETSEIKARKEHNLSSQRHRRLPGS